MYAVALSVATTAPAPMRPRRASAARLRETTPRPETSKKVAFVSLMPVMTQICSREGAPADLLAAVASPSRQGEGAL